MPSRPSCGIDDRNRAYDKRRDPRAEQLEREYNTWAKRADKLLQLLEARDQDIRLTTADCNKRFHEAEYIKDPRDAVRRIRELNTELESLDEHVRE